MPQLRDSRANNSFFFLKRILVQFLALPTKLHQSLPCCLMQRMVRGEQLLRRPRPRAVAACGGRCFSTRSSRQRLACDPDMRVLSALVSLQVGMRVLLVGLLCVALLLGCGAVPTDSFRTLEGKRPPTPPAEPPAEPPHGAGAEYAYSLVSAGTSAAASAAAGVHERASRLVRAMRKWAGAVDAPPGPDDALCSDVNWRKKSLKVVRARERESETE